MQTWANLLHSPVRLAPGPADDSADTACRETFHEHDRAADNLD